jgi:hypothetical protein
MLKRRLMQTVRQRQKLKRKMKGKKTPKRKKKWKKKRKMKKRKRKKRKSRSQMQKTTKWRKRKDRRKTHLRGSSAAFSFFFALSNKEALNRCTCSRARGHGALASSISVSRLWNIIQILAITSLSSIFHKALQDK